MPVEQQSQAPRRSRGLEDIAPQFVAKSGLCASSEVESPRGSLRIRHLVSSPSQPQQSLQPQQQEDQARFPRLDQCAHFHYDQVDLPPLQVSLYNEELKALSCDSAKCHAVQVRSHGATWLLRRSYENFRLLDQQLHRCIYDRKFSRLPGLPETEDEDQTRLRDLLEQYLSRFSQIAGNLINCGPVLNWLELDNRGRRLLIPDNDSCPINTPAVAAAYSVRQYSAQAGDEISFEVGDMISVIDMPPPEESVWWRGKRGFQVGFFPGSCVAVIGDKLPRSLILPASVGTLTQGCEPSKPVLRKHGKLIAFFRSFILARPSRRRLKQSGILKERVFGCDLGEHLLNSGHQVPMVLKCCAEFIETHGIVDGIYRLSGVTSNIQKLRNAFDEDRVPALYEDEAILQDIHSVASLLKMYFRELPNPLCTYQLYHAFVGAVGAAPEQKLIRMREAVAKLPPPHYRTLEYLMRHLARVAERGHATGMTPRNVAIVWAPNLLRCKELEVGGVAALQGVGIQAVVTEFLVCYADLIFCDNLPVVTALPPIQASPKRSRPKSLAISTPTKLLSLEEARTRALNSNSKAETDYIEVGGGPAKLPAKYHTVIELPRKRSSSKRSPLGWKSLFGKAGRKSSVRKSSTPTELGLHQETAVTESDISSGGRRRLRPVKSAESLNSGAESSRNSAALDPELSESGSPSPVAHQSQASVARGGGHNRSASHDSYFDGLETPVHARLSSRPSRLQEMENEDVSSSLDISEIQLNFDLEDSEMRIFSEDETLVSTSVGSGSLISHNSPRIRKTQPMSVKRLPSREAPPRAHPEDPLSACPSLDPSPKKQKTCAAAPSPTDSTQSKRSRLEEQLASSTGELRFIDSQSPDNTVVVQAEIHPMSYSPSDTESVDRLSATPDTPILQYTTLIDLDSNCSTTPSPLTTPSNAAFGLSLTPSPSSPSVTMPCRNSFTLMSQSSSLDIPYNRLSALNLTPNSSVSETILTPITMNDNTTPDDLFRYENVPFDTSKRSDYENVPILPTILAYQNVPPEKIVIRTEVSPLSSPIKESLVTIKYENVRSPKPSPPKEGDGDSPGGLATTVADRFLYENVDTEGLLDATPDAETDADAFWREPWRTDLVSRIEVGDSPRAEAMVTASDDEARQNIVYQNVPGPLGAELPADDDHVYEDVQLPQGSPPVCQEVTVATPQAEAPAEVVYQQVKYLRRSIHEINQLIEGVPEPTAEQAGDVAEQLSASDADAGDTGSPLVVSQDASGPTTPEDVESESAADSENGGDFPEYENCSASDSSLLGDESRVVAVGSECHASVESVSGLDSENATTDDSTQPRGSIEIVEEEEEECECENLDDGVAAASANERANEVPATTLPEKCEGESDMSGPFSVLEIVPSGDDPSSTENTGDVRVSGGVLQEPDLHCDNTVLILDNSDSRQDFQMTQTNDGPVPPSVELNIEGSPVHSVEELEQSKRRIESEIGRDILRERKMQQELEEVRFSNLGGRRPGSIKDLLSKFETSPTKEMDIGREFHSLTESRSRDEFHDGFTAVTPKLHRRYGDAGSLPPCVRARAAKTARKLANSTGLSMSLDGDHFVTSNNENQIVRVLTSPDIGKEGLESEPRPESSVLKPLNTIDDDPQRRERIERYKEERRMFLREKYRSESFRGEKDETIQRLKQKAGKTLSSPDEPMDMERAFSKATDRVRCNSFKGEPVSFEVEKPLRKREESMSANENDVDKKSSKSRTDSETTKTGRFSDSTLERAKKNSGSEKPRYKCPEVGQLEAVILGQGKKPASEETTYRNRRERLSGSPEKLAKRTGEPITCVLVKERQSSDRMTVSLCTRSPRAKDSADAETTKGPERRHSPRGSLNDAVIAPSVPTLRSPTRARLASNPDSSMQKSSLARETAQRRSSIETASVERSWKSRTSSGQSEKSPTSPTKVPPWSKSAARRSDTETSKDPAKAAGARPTTGKPRPSTLDMTAAAPPARKDLSTGSPTGPRGGKSAGSPSYCIRDMAAMFEGRDAPKSAAGRPQSQNKQYLSSM